MTDMQDPERALRQVQFVVGAIACGLRAFAGASIVLVRQRWAAPRTEIEADFRDALPYPRPVGAVRRACRRAGPALTELLLVRAHVRWPARLGRRQQPRQFVVGAAAVELDEH